MSKKYNFIINALILILMIVLVCVMLNYYAKGASKVPTNQGTTPSSHDDIAEGEKIIPSVEQEKSGENDNNVQVPLEELIVSSGEEGTVSGEERSEVIEENRHETNESPSNENMVTSSSVVEEKNKELTSPVIITSENEISSKEKREILSRIFANVQKK